MRRGAYECFTEDELEAGHSKKGSDAEEERCCMIEKGLWGL